MAGLYPLIPKVILSDLLTYSIWCLLLLSKENTKHKIAVGTLAWLHFWNIVCFSDIKKCQMFSVMSVFYCMYISILIVVLFLFQLFHFLYSPQVPVDQPDVLMFVRQSTSFFFSSSFCWISVSLERVPLWPGSGFPRGVWGAIRGRENGHPWWPHSKSIWRWHFLLSHPSKFKTGGLARRNLIFCWIW